MQTAPMTTRKLRARVTSTRDLLRQVAEENHRTLRELKPSDLSAEMWFKYRAMTQTIEGAGADAALLADLLGTLAELPAIKTALESKAA
jgi:hypothetical protein